MRARNSMIGATTERQLCDLVVHEAALIDAHRFDEWLALFADDCRYWIPLQGAAQSESEQHNALADEDKLLLTLRVERLKSPKAHSQHPPSRCQHVLQQPRIVQADITAGRCELHTPFIYIESRGEQQTMLAGVARHRLVRRDQGWQIALKRVDLLNAGAALPAIQLFP
jgi:3-phenylpropionate/cinnamic acid dioxygenase small subunit